MDLFDKIYEKYSNKEILLDEWLKMEWGNNGNLEEYVKKKVFYIS